jgi:hypothetical protein
MNPEPLPQEPKKPKQKKLRMILGIIVLIVGLLVCTGGITVFIYNQGTDSEGYSYSNIYHVNTTAYAFTAYMNPFTSSTWGFLGMENIAQVKYIVTNNNPGNELFIGYATTAQSDAYRKSFQCEIPTYWRWHVEPYYAEIDITTTVKDGAGAPASLPQTQTFWLTSAQATNTAIMTYLPLNEQHVWFIMNSDGSRNITADIQIGFKSPILTILPMIFLPLGILLLVGGALLLRKKKDKTKTAE